MLSSATPANPSFDRPPACAAPAPLVITSLFGSTTRASGRLALPPSVQLKAAFAELKVDLRGAVLPHGHVVLVCESLCASVEILLPAGASVVDNSAVLLSSHKLGQPATVSGGPVVYLEGWSVCSDVKVIAPASGDAPAPWRER